MNSQRRLQKSTPLEGSVQLFPCMFGDSMTCYVANNHSLQSTPCPGLGSPNHMCQHGTLRSLHARHKMMLLTPMQAVALPMVWPRASPFSAALNGTETRAWQRGGTRIGSRVRNKGRRSLEMLPDRISSEAHCRNLPSERASPLELAAPENDKGDPTHPECCRWATSLVLQPSSPFQCARRNHANTSASHLPTQSTVETAW